MNPETRLPDPLARLIRRLRLRPVSVGEITGRPANRSERRTFRIGLDDGSTVKGRTVRSSDKAREMWEWIPHLPREAFPPILGAAENAVRRYVDAAREVFVPRQGDAAPAEHRGER